MKLASILIALLMACPQGTIKGTNHRKIFPAGGGGGGGATFVQACTNDKNSAGAADITCTLSGGTTSGNGMAFYVFWGLSSGSASAPATGDITDASSDTISFVVNNDDSANFSDAAMYLATTVTAGTTVFTFKCSTRTATLLCAGFEGIVGFEVHGGSRLSDGSAVATNRSGSKSTNADTCSSFTTGTNSDLVVFGATDNNNNTTTFSAGTSPFTFTVPTNGRSANLLATMEYGTQTTAGSVNPAFTGDTTNVYDGVCMGIK